MKAKSSLTFSIVVFLALLTVSMSEAVEPGDVYLYDLRTTSLTCLSCLVDADGLFDDDSPKIDGVKVMWTQFDEAGSSSFLFDIAQGITSEIPEGFVWGESPQKDGDLMVSTVHDRHDREIFLTDTAADTRQQITENSIDDAAPCISGEAIAWVHGVGPDSEIILARNEANYKDFSGEGFEGVELSHFPSSSRVTTNADEDAFPHISENYLVWQGKRGDDWEIFLYDMGTENTIQITDNGYNDNSPKTDGEYVVWLAYNNSGGEIFSYDIANRTTHQITNNTLIENPPQLANGKVVWASFELARSAAVDPEDENSDDNNDASDGDSSDSDNGQGNGGNGGGGGGGGSCFVNTVGWEW